MVSASMASISAPTPPQPFSASPLSSSEINVSLCRSSLTHRAQSPPVSRRHPCSVSAAAAASISDERKETASISHSHSDSLLPLSLLKNFSSMHEVKQIHAQMIRSNAIRDSLCFSKLLHLCSKSSNPVTSILLFVRLLEEDPYLLHPHSFPPILKACAKISAVFEGAQIHSSAIKGGLESDTYVQNSAIQMYFGCGRHLDAQLLFDKMPERSVVTWNCLIAGYSDLGLWGKVISLFWMMIGEGLIEPNMVTLMRVVTACARCDDFGTGKKVHRYIIENGIPLLLNLGNALLNMYVKFGEIELAGKLFDELLERDVVSWTTLVSGYAVVHLVREAREVFDKMPDRNVVAWNAMIAGYVLNGWFDEALLLYKEMLILNVKPDKSTILSVLSACSRSDDLPVGEVIHGYITKVGFDVTLDLLHSILGLYSKCGEMNKAEWLFRKMNVRNEISWTLMMTGYLGLGEEDLAMEIFNQMPNKDIASWNALITMLVRNNHFNEAMNIFQNMLRKKVTPNSLTLVSTLSACSSLGALESGKWIHSYIKQKKIKMDVKLSSSLMDMYAKCGCIELSLEVFDKTPAKDLLAWSTIIRGLAMNGCSKLALEYYRKMEDSAVQPDAITFLGVLSACSHGGLLYEGQHYFEKMIGFYHISPVIEHYSCMVDLLGRHGLLKQAKDFVEEIKIPSSGEAIWGAMVNACKLHGDIELAQFATDRLLEVNPRSSGAYVMLSNVYANASKWDSVNKIRNMMKGKGIKKVPGCSSIEVNGVVQEFFIGDTSHPKSRDIHMVLVGLEKLMEIV